MRVPITLHSAARYSQHFAGIGGELLLQPVVLAVEPVILACEAACGGLFGTPDAWVGGPRVGKLLLSAVFSCASALCSGARLRLGKLLLERGALLAQHSVLLPAGLAAPDDTTVIDRKALTSSTA